MEEEYKPNVIQDVIACIIILIVGLLLGGLCTW